MFNFNLWDYLNPFKTKYSIGDFIQTRLEDNRGGIVMRIEQVDKLSLICSTGSFRIRDNRRKWFIKKKIDISLNNIERKVSVQEAEKLIALNVAKLR